MHKAPLVAVIKANGKPLSEKSDGTVTLPFNCEYSIMLKNLSKSNDLNVQIDIDGEPIFGTSTSGITLKPGETKDVSGRKIDNKEFALKFIKKTKAISAHRGDRIDDGLVVIHFAEVVPPSRLLRDIERHYHDECPDAPFHTFDRTWIKGGRHPKRRSPVVNPGDWGNFKENNLPKYHLTAEDSMRRGLRATYSSDSNISERRVSADMLNTSTVSAGITTLGQEVTGNKQSSVSIQGRFQEWSSIVFKLTGSNESGEAVTKPIIVPKEKIKCCMCGTKNRPQARYCDQCGTNLAASQLIQKQ